MCCVWVSGLNQIDIDASAPKLLLFTSLSHSPTQLCQDYSCCHHSPSPPLLQLSSKCITTSESGRTQMCPAEIHNFKCFFFPTMTYRVKCLRLTMVWHIVSARLYWSKKCAASPHHDQINSFLFHLQQLLLFCHS